MTRKRGELWHVDVQTAIEVFFHEAVVRQAYHDSENVLTWSTGLTNATGHRVERYIRNPQTLERCIEVAVWALERYAEHVRQAFKGIEITKEQFTAALSFHWNTGGIKKAQWVKHFRNGEIGKARAAFMNWRSPPEILGRRELERDLFFDGTWASNGTILEITEVNQKTLAPIWSSARRVDIREQVAQALKKHNLETLVPLDQEPKPDNVPKAPTLSPTDALCRKMGALKLNVTGPLDLERLKELEIAEISLPEREALTQKARDKLRQGMEEKFPSLSTASVILVILGTVLATAWNWIINLPCNALGIFCGG